MLEQKDLLQLLYSRKAFFTIGLAFMVSLLISPGFFIQEALFGLMDLDAYTLYEAVHGEAINRSPQFGNWLKSALAPEFAAISIFTCIFAITRKNRGGFLISVWISIFVGLTGIDIISAFQAGTLSIAYLIKNIVSNAIGAVFVSGLAAITMSLAEKIDSRGRVPITLLIVPVFMGLALSSILFLSLALFTHLLPVKTVISLEGAISGYLARGKAGDAKHGGERGFSLIPNDLRFKQLELSGSDNLSVRWERTKLDTEFSISVYLVGICWSSSDLEEIPTFSPLFTRENIQSVSIVSDAASKQLQVVGAQSLLTISDSPISSFWIKNDQAVSAVDVTEFLSHDARVTSSTNGTFSIRLAGTMMERGEDVTNLTSKNFTLSIDGQDHQFEFSPPLSLSDEKVTPCTFIEGGIDESGATVIDDSVLGGLLLKFERTSIPSGYTNDFDGIIFIEKANGWMSIPDISIQDLSQTGGRVDFLSFSSPSSRVSVNSRSIDMSAGQTFTGYGSLSTWYQRDGSLLASGSLLAAWSEGKRLNSTRWELLPTELKIALASIFGAFLLWSANLAVRRKWSNWGQSQFLDEPN